MPSETATKQQTTARPLLNHRLDKNINAARHVLYSLVEDTLVLRIKAATQKNDLMSASITETTLQLIGLPEDLHASTLERFARQSRPQCSLGTFHQQIRAQEDWPHAELWDVLHRSLNSKAIKHDPRVATEESQEKAWSLAIIDWLFDLDGVYTSAQLTSAEYDLRLKLRNSKIEIWSSAIPFPLSDPNEKLIDEPSRGKDRKKSVWMKKLPSIEYGGDIKTPRLVTGNYDRSNEIAPTRVQSLEKGALVFLPMRLKGLPKGVPAESGIDKKGWIRHEKADAHAPWLRHEAFPCSACQGANVLEFSTEKQEEPSQPTSSPDAENETKQQQFSIYREWDDLEFATHAQTLVDTLSAHLCATMKRRTTTFSSTAITNKSLRRLKGFPSIHIKETLNQLRSSRKFGAYHQRMRFGGFLDNSQREDQCPSDLYDIYVTPTFHRMHDVARYLMEHPPKVLGSAWYHDMFKYIYGLKLDKTTYKSDMRYRVLEKEESRKIDFMRFWASDVDVDAGGGDRRVIPWMADAPPEGSNLATLELEKVEKDWAAHGNELWNLRVVKLGEGVATPKLVVDETGAVYKDQWATEGENRRPEKGNGSWDVDMRVWVRDAEGNYKGSRPEQVNMDDFVDEKGWVHHKESFHAGFVEEDGVKKPFPCRRCKEVSS